MHDGEPLRIRRRVFGGRHKSQKCLIKRVQQRAIGFTRSESLRFAGKRNTSDYSGDRRFRRTPDLPDIFLLRNQVTLKTSCVENSYVSSVTVEFRPTYM